jgi:hypothetical protein
VPIVFKSGILNLLEPSGPVMACNGIALPLIIQTARRNLLQYFYNTLTALTAERIDRNMEKTQRCRLCAVMSSAEQKTGNIMFPYGLCQSGKWPTHVSLQIYRTVSSRGSRSLTSVLRALAMLKCSQWLRAIRWSIN